MEIRAIKDNEKDAFMQACRYAFGNWSNEPVTDLEVLWLDPQETMAIFEDDELVSGLICYNLEQNVRNKILKMGGIGAVHSYPEIRRKGYINSLMTEVFAIMKEKNISVSMLSPFKESYYSKYGYATTTGHLILKFNPIALKEEHTSENYQTFRTSIAESWEEYLIFQREITGLIHGLVNPGVSKANHLFLKAKNNMLIFFRRNYQNVAMIRYNKTYHEIGEISVEEIFWKDEDSRRAVFSYLRKHIDQIKDITMPVALNINFYNWFDNAANYLTSSIKGNAWMVRIIDIADALSRIPVNTSGELTIAVSDPYCPWNRGTYLLKSENGLLNCTRSDLNSGIPIDISDLSALLYGAFSSEEISYRFGNKTNLKGIELIQDWFIQKFMFNTCKF